MAGSETSFNSYTFTYNWKINGLETRLHNPTKLNSPSFSSPSGTRPATKWMLTVFKSNDSVSPTSVAGLDLFGTQKTPAGQQSLSVNLTRLDFSHETTPKTASGSLFASVNNVRVGGAGAPLQLPQLGIGSGLGRAAPVPFQLAGTVPSPLLQKHNDAPFQLAGTVPSPVPQKSDDDAESVWVEANLTPLIDRVNVVTSKYKCTTQGPTNLYSPKTCFKGRTNVMSFQRFLSASLVRGSKSVTLSCQIKVWSLDKPIHVSNELQPSAPNSTNADEMSDFSLSKCMEEARQNDQFTDVTLVANGREFKAHKVVPGSQSQFFKTRFSSRWTGPSGDRVEMTDVPGVIMEAILSYMYTRKVADIGKIANQLLPVAEEYGLVGLRKMCEKALITSLTSTTAISMLIYAASHNAPDLKKACMEFIVSNTAAVRQSEGWGKLKETQMYRDLWVELLERIAEK